MGAVLDFSVNSNPLGPPPAVADAIASADPYRYPDNQCLALRRALAGPLGIGIEHIVAGNGSVELIWLLALAYVRPGDSVVVLGPTFGEYSRAAALHGGRVLFFDAQEGDGFRLDVEAAARFIRSHRPRLVFLCNPNNPTGLHLERGALRVLLSSCEHGLLVVDQAYLGFVEAPDPLVDWLSGWATVLLRSMTKDYGLAGLRLGYVLAAPPVAEALDKVRPPWSVNAVAQAAGLAALSDKDHLRRGREASEKAKAYLSAELSAMGFPVVPSAANFIMVRVGDAAAFRGALLRRTVCVRDCTSFGLPRFVRIGMRPLPECRILVQAVKGALKDASYRL